VVVDSLRTHAHTHARTHTHTHTHTHPFNGPFSGTTRVSQYQKGKINLDFTEARDSESQWHQLGHMQVCTSLQTDNHASNHHSVFYRPDALPGTQPTASKHWRHILLLILSQCKKHKSPSGATPAHREVLISVFADLHCETMNTGLVHRGACLFTPQFQPVLNYTAW